MTKIQELMDKSDECITKAITYMHSNELDLAAFYANAAKGYKDKVEHEKLEYGNNRRGSQ